MTSYICKVCIWVLLILETVFGCKRLRYSSQPHTPRMHMGGVKVQLHTHIHNLAQDGGELSAPCSGSFVPSKICNTR